MNKNIGLVVVVTLIIMVSCKAHINTYENDLGITPSSLASIDTANFTQIEWIDTIKTFQPVKEGDGLQLKFKFKNTGKTALFILATLPSCGCTLTDYPATPILPEHEGFITAIVNTMGLRGFTKKHILVKTNTKNRGLQQLEFNGNIIPLSNK